MQGSIYTVLTPGQSGPFPIRLNHVVTKKKSAATAGVILELHHVNCRICHHHLHVQAYRI